MSELIDALQKQLKENDTTDILSLDVIRKSEEIEKLAQQVREFSPRLRERFSLSRFGLNGAATRRKCRRRLMARSKAFYNASSRHDIKLRACSSDG